MSSKATNPWWYSGDDQEAGEESESAAGTDWLGAISGLIDWASDLVLAPHAEHQDPRDHPQCLLCRARGWMGEVPRGERPERPEIEWIDVRDK